MVKVNPSVN